MKNKQSELNGYCFSGPSHASSSRSILELLVFCGEDLMGFFTLALGVAR